MLQGFFLVTKNERLRGALSTAWAREEAPTYAHNHAHPPYYPPRAQMTDPSGKKAVKIMVPSKDKDPKDKKGGDDGGKEVPTLDGVEGGEGGGGLKKGKKKTKGGKDIVEPEELSEEDKALKEGLELAVTRVDDPEPGIGRFCFQHYLARNCKVKESRFSPRPSYLIGGGMSLPHLAFSCRVIVLSVYLVHNDPSRPSSFTVAANHPIPVPPCHSRLRFATGTATALPS